MKSLTNLTAGLVTKQVASYDFTGAERRTIQRSIELFKKEALARARNEMRFKTLCNNMNVRDKAMLETKRKTVLAILREALALDCNDPKYPVMIAKAEVKAKTEELFRECYITAIKETLTEEELEFITNLGKVESLSEFFSKDEERPDLDALLKSKPNGLKRFFNS